MCFYLARRGIISALAVLCLLSTVFLTANHCEGQVEKESGETQIEGGNEDSKQVDAIEREIVKAVFEVRSSGVPLIESHAYAMLSQHKNLHEILSEEEIISVISGALKGDYSVMEYGFSLLEESKLSEQKKNSLLLNALSSKDSSVVNESLKLLSKSKTELLPKIIDSLNGSPVDDHKNELRLLEHWGPDAVSAVPALIKHYDALREKELANGIKRSTVKEIEGKALRSLKFDYLPLVYAIAEMGPEAKPAIKIGLAAIKEKNNSNRKDVN